MARAALGLSPDLDFTVENLEGRMFGVETCGGSVEARVARLEGRVARLRERVAALKGSGDA